jgi:1-acyl-sn-glycerol-3-phosphate acyltransferase
MMESHTDERFPTTWRQRLVLKPLTRALKLYYRPTVHGLDQVPLDRPVLYVAKHPRGYLYLEIMLFGLIAFWDNERPPIRPMEKRGTSLHRTPILSWMRRHVGAIEASEEEALRVVALGESLLLFPGGPRELRGAPDRLRWIGRGFARLAARAGIPIVPLAIAGADQQHPWRFPVGDDSSLWLPPIPLPVRLDYWFGAPLQPPPLADAEALGAFAERVAAETQALLDQAVAARGLRGPPA